MLMIGESILSLVIVHVDKGGPMYYLTFFLGVGTMTIFLFANSRMSKTENEDHAMRSKSRRPVYLMISQLFSLCVVSIGISFKMMLNEFIEGRIISKTIQNSSENNGTEKINLIEKIEDLERKRIAAFFCIVFVLSLVLMEAMNLFHKSGIIKIKKLKLGQKIGLALLRISTLIFAGTPVLYTSDPPILFVIGNTAVILTFIHTFILDHLLKRIDDSTSVEDEEI